MKELLENNEALITALSTAEERIAAIKEQVSALAHENEQILATASFDDLEAVDTLTRNRTRIELGPRAIKLAQANHAKVINEMKGAFNRSRDALQDYYKKIDDVLMPKARKACIEAFGDEFKNWAPYKQNEEGIFNTKIYSEEIYPHLRHQVKVSSQIEGALGPLQLVNEEIQRVMALHAELKEEIKATT